MGSELCSVPLDSFRIVELWEGVMLYVCVSLVHTESE